MPDRKLPVIYVVLDVDTNEFKRAADTKGMADKLAFALFHTTSGREFKTIAYPPPLTCKTCPCWPERGRHTPCTFMPDDTRCCSRHPDAQREKVG